MSPMSSVGQYPRQIVYRITAAQAQAMEEYRTQERLTITRVIEDALTEYFDRRDLEWPVNTRRIA